MLIFEILSTAVFITLEVMITYYVGKEYYESKETNRVLTRLMSKQRKQKQKISVDRVIKAAING